MNNKLSKREFLQWSAAAALAGAGSFAAPAAERGPYRGAICLFSKPMAPLGWGELAQSAKHAGFGGIDLTVRGGGHVLPQRVTEDLPKAVAAIRGEGLDVPMITTELLSAEDPTTKPIIEAASKLSIRFLKPGYYHYKLVDVRTELEQAGEQFRGLVNLAREYGVQVGYHNHAGYIGAPVWDMARIMDTLDSKWAGYYFDLQHATSEGGVGGWKIATNLVMPRMKMMAVKDLYWRKLENGDWRAQDCPLGQGMCHYKDFLKLAAAGGFQGPISLHVEYEIPGVSSREGIALSKDKCGEVMAAAKRDLDYLKSLMRQSYEA